MRRTCAGLGHLGLDAIGQRAQLATDQAAESGRHCRSTTTPGGSGARPREGLREHGDARRRHRDRAASRVVVGAGRSERSSASQSCQVAITASAGRVPSISTRHSTSLPSCNHAARRLPMRSATSPAVPSMAKPIARVHRDASTTGTTPSGIARSTSWRMCVCASASVRYDTSGRQVSAPSTTRSDATSCSSPLKTNPRRGAAAPARRLRDRDRDGGVLGRERAELLELAEHRARRTWARHRRSRSGRPAAARRGRA